MLRTDDFSQTLWREVMRLGLGSPADRVRAKRVEHLARGYQRGVSAEEVMERIEKGELDAR